MNDLNEQLAKVNERAQNEQGASTLGNVAGIAGDGTSIAADVAGGVAVEVATDITLSTITDVAADLADGALGVAGEVIGGIFDGI